MNWKDIEPSDLELLKEIRIQYHQAIQSISAVGRHFLEPSPSDENATLSWNRSKHSLVGKWVDTDHGSIRAGMSLTDAVIYLETAGTIDQFPLQGKTFGQLMVWLEEQVGRSGLPIASFSANLPYELPPYPKLGSKGFDLQAGELAAKFSYYFSNTYEVLDTLQWDFDEEGEVLVYPEHFDQALSVKLKDSGDVDTSTYVTLGMSPGDTEFAQPYFYVNSWPHVDETILKPLPAGSWYTEDWVGGLITAEDIWPVQNQKDYLTDFYRESSKQLRDFLLD